MIVIYTDGSAKGNGKANAKGGFGIVVCQAWGDEGEENYTPINFYQEEEDGTTNNRMEMKAILWALENYGKPPEGKESQWTSLMPIVYSDSSYAVNSFTVWIKGWKNNGWKRAHNKPVENLDLVKKWDELVGKGYAIDLRHCAGHSGNKWNELADALATGRLKATFGEEIAIGGSK